MWTVKNRIKWTFPDKVLFSTVCGGQRILFMSSGGGCMKLTYGGLTCCVLTQSFPFQEFDAFKKHTGNLLKQEKELNEKLRFLIGWYWTDVCSMFQSSCERWFRAHACRYVCFAKCLWSLFLFRHLSLFTFSLLRASNCFCNTFLCISVHGLLCS